MSSPVSSTQGISNVQLRRLLFRFCGWFFLSNTVIFWCIGFHYLLTAFPVSYDLLSPFFKTVIVIYLLFTWLSHFALLAFIPAIIVYLCLWLIPHPRLILTLAPLLATGALTCLILDTVVFSQFHFHLNGVFFQMALSSARYEFFALAPREIFSLSFGICAVLLLEYGYAQWLWKKILAYHLPRYGYSIAGSLLTCLLFSYLMFLLSATLPNDYAVIAQQPQVFPLYNHILSLFLPLPHSLRTLENIGRTHIVQPTQVLKPLHYPLHPLVCTPPKNPLNLLLIVIDAWRFDMLNPEVVPHVAEFARHATRFTQHSSGGNATLPGIFTLFYGIPGSYWSSVLHEERSPVLLDTLRTQHYRMGIFSSAALFMPPFHRTVFSKVPALSLQTPGENALLRDHHITEDFLHFLNQHHDASQPFFGFLFYDSAHSYCDIPPLSGRFQPVISHCNRLTRSGTSNPLPYLNQYKNALGTVDSEIGIVLATLKKKHLLDHTLVMITSDHGQEFNDNGQGYWEHAGNFTRPQVQVPLVLYWPHHRAKVIHWPTSHFDIPPTLMTSLLGCKNSPADYSVGKLLSSPMETPYLLISSYINYGLVEKEHITTIYPTGDYEIENTKAQTLSHQTLHFPVLKSAFFDMMKFYRTS